MISLEINVQPIIDMTQRVSLVAEGLSDPAKLVQVVEEATGGADSPLLNQWARAEIDAGGSPPGGPWERNADFTVQRKGFDKPLFVRGDLRDSFVFQTQIEAGEAVTYVSNTARSKDGDNMWAKNWEGFDNPKEAWGPIPPRPSGYVPDARMAYLIEQLHRALVSVVMGPVLIQQPHRPLISAIIDPVLQRG